jgi:hypothetical protein
MCNKEADETIRFNSLAWHSKKKWFGTYEFVTSRVKDGKFNNSQFKLDRYCRLLEFTIMSPMGIFDKCGYNEFMLDICKANNFKFTVKEIIT